MTTIEAAAILGIDKRSVAALCKRGALRATRHGRDWWIEAEEVERYKAVPKNKGGRPKREANS